MKNVKTYEGFLDFFKRKPKSTAPSNIIVD